MRSQPVTCAPRGHTKITKEAKHTKSEHDPAHALLEQDNIEIHQECDAFVRYPKIRERLRFMKARQGLDRFHLDDDLILDQQV